LRTVGVDLDGTISKAGLYNPSLKLPCWLFVFLVPIIVLTKPDKRAVRRLKEFEEADCKIVIISARPPWAYKITEMWFSAHKIPFTKIFCVGFGKGTKQRKIDIIEKEGIDHFFDDDKRMANFLNQHSVKATSIFS